MPKVIGDGYTVTLNRDEWEAIAALINFAAPADGDEVDEESDAYKMWDKADDVLIYVVDGIEKL